MLDLHVVLTGLGVAIPAVAASLVTHKAEARVVSAVASAFTLGFVALAAAVPHPRGALLAIDGLAAAPALIFASLMTAIFVTAPRRDVDGPACARMLTGMAGALLIYSAGNPLLLLIGWVVSLLPLTFLRGSNTAGTSAHELVALHARPSVMAFVSSAALALSVALYYYEPRQFDGSLSAGPVSTAIVILAMLAAFLRSGLFPLHSWLMTLFREERLLGSTAIVMAQPAAFLIARLAAPAFGGLADLFVNAAAYFALISTLLLAIMGLAERSPRRILATIAATQSGMILSGVLLANMEAVTGALVQWLVVAAGITGTAIVLRSLEARCGHITEQPLAGLGSRAPRLAVLFLLFSLAIAGLPGTLGFAAGDLLFHGALDAHPLLGLALPAATALNAVHLLKLFSNLFLGRRAPQVPLIGDALTRERWALSALVVFLIGMGLAPHWIVKSRAAPAQAISDALEHRRGDPAAPVKNAQLTPSR